MLKNHNIVSDYNITQNNFEELSRQYGYEILNSTFDDIKRSKYFKNICQIWDNLGFTLGVIGEKYENLCIAYTQITLFLLSNPDLNDIKENIKYDELNNIITNKNSFKEYFETIIYPIIRYLYTFLPLSDYDYIEIIDSLKEINVDSNEIIKYDNEEEKYIAYLSNKIINLINSK